MRAAVGALVAVVLLVAGLLWWLGADGAPVAAPDAVVEHAADDETRRHDEQVAGRGLREEQAERLGVARAVVPVDAPPVPVESAPAVEGTLEVTVLHADRTPAERAQVVLARDKLVLDRGETDAAGLVVLTSSGSEPVDLWVAGPVLPPLHVGLAPAIGVHEIVLTDLGVLSGQVLVDGSAPGRPVPVGLGGMRRPRDMPHAVWRASRRPDTGLAHRVHDAAVWTDAAGRFFVSGLPEGETVGLHGEHALQLESGEERHEVTVPDLDVLLRFTTRPQVTGRVVDGDGRPALDAEVTYGVSFRSSRFMGPVVAVDEDGRFAIPIPVDESPLRSVSLEITAAAGRVARDVAAEDIDPEHGRDLGDLVLRATRDVAFVVRGPDGVPVPGALAVSDDRFETRSEPTDAQGRGRLLGLPAETRRFTVWADRFATATVEIPEPAGGSEPTGASEPDPLVVVVSPCPCLDVRVTASEAAGGALPENLVVRVAAEAVLFDSHESFAPPQLRKEVAGLDFSTASFQSSPEGMTGDATLHLGADGLVVLQCLQAGVPFEVSIRDPFRQDLWGPTTVVAGSVDVLDVVLDHTVRAVDVRVRDDLGAPVERATVNVAAGEHGRSERTDAEGLARIESVAADVELVGVTVRATGFATYQRPDVPLPASGPIEVVLERGRRVVVSVADETGRPAAATGVAVLGGSDDEVHEVQPADPTRSRWVIEDLPPEVVRLEASVGGRTFTWSHDARNPDARLTVPAFGSVRVRWSGALDPESYWTVGWTEAVESDRLAEGMTTRAGASVPTATQGWHGLTAEAMTAGETLIPVVFAGPHAFALGRRWPLALHAGPASVEVVVGAEVEVVLEPVTDGDG